MISLEELRQKAKMLGLSLGNAEKDYILSLMLSIISRRTKNELVFKGGTCLYRFYGLDRFSEDIDFSAIRPIDVESLSRAIVADMKLFGINCILHAKREPHNSILLTFRCEGPLYKGNPMAYSGVNVDINLKSAVELEPANKEHSSLYQEVPRFSLLVMQESEILAEKIRAIMSRTKARDIYDLHYLIRKGLKPDKELVEKKFGYYGYKWDQQFFAGRVAAVESVWQKELARLVAKTPLFDEAKGLVVSESKKWNL